LSLGDSLGLVLLCTVIKEMFHGLQLKSSNFNASILIACNLSTSLSLCS